MIKKYIYFEPMTLLNFKNNNRIFSIDFARGLAMVIMALDHTRDFFHKFSFFHDAIDLDHTSTPIFFTRWITYFCAPAFIFLSGTSAFLSGQRKTKKELSIFLFKRGLWLILLEITIVGFAWLFDTSFSHYNLQVIWAIGICMLALSLLIHLPFRFMIAIAIILIAGHNFLDNIHITGNVLSRFVWSTLHEFGFFQIGTLSIYVVYPVIPWIGLMTLGYCFGRLYLPDISFSFRKKILIRAGLFGITTFLLLRYINNYGDPSPWAEQNSPLFTFLSFLNTSKYPPSLLFLLMTISPLMLFLSVTETVNNRFSRWMSVFGKVPLFYYVLHLYLIHIAAMIAGFFQGYPLKAWFFSSGWVSEEASLKGFGFSLPGVYLIWLIIILLLYFPCRWYAKYKLTHKHWWLSYV